MIYDKILLEIEVSMVGFKIVSERSSTSVMTLLGDIGGFKGFFQDLVAWIAEFFAAKFFMQSVAENMFVKKLSS